MSQILENETGSGAGSRLPTVVLFLAGVSTVVAVVVSAMSIHLQLKNYRKPILQRMVIRIMIMVPLYAISSLIALFSLQAAFVIDVIRDIYEAFVIYCFFVLLLSYLGGERSLLILLHGRPPKVPVFPVNIFKSELDVSDPYTFLFLKRGILQYVQIKPILAIVTLILKALGKYNEGNFRANSGYLYVSIVYNTSICLSLYCLAMFWLCVNDDLKPFRPVPKFLCVKGILFFSFWQSILISILVAAGAIKKLGPYTDEEHISLGLTDTLICLEMPFFAIAHLFAFSYTDYIDVHRSYVARMPIYYAFRDAFGLLDVVEDSKVTLRGEGMDYREFEPSEGQMHQGAGRDKRIRAGLRYSKGGKRKYWLPKPNEDTQPPGRVERGVNRIITRVAGRNQGEEVHAPLLANEADDVVHLAPDLSGQEEATIWGEPNAEGGYDLPFGDIDEADEELFEHSKKYLFGDYNYPCIDVSSESARTVMWDEEERVLRDERGAWFSPIRGSKGVAAIDQRGGPAWEGYGAVGNHPRKPDGLWNGKGKARTDGVNEGRNVERVIDYEQDRTPAVDTGDVKLKWTKTKSSGSRSNSRSRSPRIIGRAPDHSGPSSAESSSSRGKIKADSPSSVSRSNSRTALPPDAVDLIVEDSAAAQEERTKERRKGEPAVTGSALKKVYRRGFVTHDSQGRKAQGEVEVADEHPSDDTRRLDVGEGILDDLGDEGEDAEPIEYEEPSSHFEAEAMITRAVTPPLHARLAVDSYGTPSELDENPWA